MPARVLFPQRRLFVGTIYKALKLLATFFKFSWWVTLNDLVTLSPLCHDPSDNCPTCLSWLCNFHSKFHFQFTGHLEMRKVLNSFLWLLRFFLVKFYKLEKYWKKKIFHAVLYHKLFVREVNRVIILFKGNSLDLVCWRMFLFSVLSLILQKCLKTSSFAEKRFPF